MTPKVDEETIAGDAGALFVRSWRSATPPKAVVAICHGFNSHSGYYDWTGEQFAASGFAIYAVDLRGRGKSEGERFFVESFDDYVSDLEALVDLARRREPQAPVSLLGHNAGGVVACLYSLGRPHALAGLVCEDIAFELPAPGLALAALKGVSHFAPHAQVLKLANKNFTRDSTILARMNDDPLIAQESQPSAIAIPLLILHGADDKAAKASGSRRPFNAAGSKDKTLKIYDGRLHDPLNDLGRDEVLSDVTACLEKRVAA